MKISGEGKSTFLICPEYVSIYVSKQISEHLQADMLTRVRFVRLLIYYSYSAVSVEHFKPYGAAARFHREDSALGLQHVHFLVWITEFSLRVR